MSFTDPQSVTINGVATSLVRLSSDLSSSTYRSPDQLVSMVMRHRALKQGRQLHQARLEQQILAADPLDPSLNRYNSMAVTFSVNTPAPGYITPTIQGYLTSAFTGWLTASSGARVTQLLNGEL